MIRTIVTVHLPLEMGAVGRIMQVVAREYPDAVVANVAGGFGIAVGIAADDDAGLTKADRRRIVREREKAAGR